MCLFHRWVRYPKCQCLLDLREGRDDWGNRFSWEERAAFLKFARVESCRSSSEEPNIICTAQVYRYQQSELELPRLGSSAGPRRSQTPGQALVALIGSGACRGCEVWRYQSSEVFEQVLQSRGLDRQQAVDFRAKWNNTFWVKQDQAYEMWRAGEDRDLFTNQQWQNLWIDEELNKMAEQRARKAAKEAERADQRKKRQDLRWEKKEPRPGVVVKDWLA